MNKTNFDTFRLICQPAVLSNILTSMTSKSLREVAFHVCKNHLEIRNHINHPEKDVQTVRLKFKLDPAEFTSYDVFKESCLILSSQDLLSIVDLAENVKDELKIVFTKNGKPFIASVLSSEGSARIQMAMSSLREETLNSIRKPPLATSYKQVVNSYLETRKSVHGSEYLEQSFAELSDTEMQRAISPKVGTFESNQASGSKLRLEKKRKSIEMLPLPDEDFDATNADIVSSFEQMKKQKIDVVQSQEEAQEVSQIMADLENMNYDDDDDVRNGNPPRNTSSLNLLAGMEKMKFNIKMKVSTRDTLSGGETSDSDQAQNSARFDRSKAKFATDELFSSQNFPSTTSLNENQRASVAAVSGSKSGGENRAKPKKTPSQVQKIVSTNRYAKKSFGILKQANSSFEGRTLAPSSDPESD